MVAQLILVQLVGVQIPAGLPIASSNHIALNNWPRRIFEGRFLQIRRYSIGHSLRPSCRASSPQRSINIFAFLSSYNLRPGDLLT